MLLEKLFFLWHSNRQRRKLQEKNARVNDAQRNLFKEAVAFSGASLIDPERRKRKLLLFTFSELIDLFIQRRERKCGSSSW